VRGIPEQAEPIIQACLDDVLARGEGVGVNVAMWARAVLCNGLGRYGEALDAARAAAADPLELGPPQWALAELVEAAVHAGDARTAREGLEHLSTMAHASGTDWALGVEASRHAMLSDGAVAEDLHRTGIAHLSRTTMRLELARAQLLYGEWLRRQGRSGHARTQLRSAYEALSAMGAEAFAERARHELHAAGEKVDKRTLASHGDFTAQESQIAKLAAQGLTNAEIGAMLFISPRTVEWHLRNVFNKLGVKTRRELRRLLPNGYRTGPE
jgi:DNA-binding CsgD family transcriptional regulator